MPLLSTPKIFAGARFVTTTTSLAHQFFRFVELLHAANDLAFLAPDINLQFQQLVRFRYRFCGQGLFRS